MVWKMVCVGYARFGFALGMLVSCCLSPFCSGSRVLNANVILSGIWAIHVMDPFIYPSIHTDLHKYIHKRISTQKMSNFLLLIIIVFFSLLLFNEFENVIVASDMN